MSIFYRLNLAMVIIRFKYRRLPNIRYLNHNPNHEYAGFTDQHTHPCHGHAGYSDGYPVPTDTAPVFAANAIAFFAFKSHRRTSEIKVMQSDGDDLQSIPVVPVQRFSSSPDKTPCLYRAFQRVVGHVYGHADGKNKSRLTQGHLDYSPSSSPDGAQLAFSRKGNLWVMRVSNDPLPR